MYFYRCPHCQKEVQVEDNMAGQTMTCPHCSKPFTIPDLNSIPMVQMHTTPAQPQNLPLATKSMILGIVSFIGGPLCGLSAFISGLNYINLFSFIGVSLCGLLALITGSYSKEKINSSNGLLLGKGKAITGIVLGTYSMIKFLIILVLAISNSFKASHLAREIPCSANMKQIGLAAMMYSHKNDGYLPQSIDDIQQFLSASALIRSAHQSKDDNYVFVPLEERKITKIKNLHETPIIICTKHKYHDIVLYADGHMENRPKKNKSQP